MEKAGRSQSVNASAKDNFYKDTPIEEEVSKSKHLKGDIVSCQAILTPFVQTIDSNPDFDKSEVKTENRKSEGSDDGE